METGKCSYHVSIIAIETEDGIRSAKERSLPRAECLGEEVKGSCMSQTSPEQVLPGGVYAGQFQWALGRWGSSGQVQYWGSHIAEFLTNCNDNILKVKYMTRHFTEIQFFFFFTAIRVEL